eukprot:2673471-Rhodomonas_salina.3
MQGASEAPAAGSSGSERAGAVSQQKAPLTPRGAAVRTSLTKWAACRWKRPPPDARPTIYISGRIRRLPWFLSIAGLQKPSCQSFGFAVVSEFWSNKSAG